MCHDQNPAHLQLPLTHPTPKRVRIQQGGVFTPFPVRRIAVPPSSDDLISCLMVTRDRKELVHRAITGFQAQTYPNRELIIVNDNPADGTRELVAGLHDARIRFIGRPDNAEPLGRLRNIALHEAAGSYVCQWDDDDLCAPQRLAHKYACLKATDADAAFLERWTFWWPARRQLYYSVRRTWEGSMLARKAILPGYPEIRRGEDTPVRDAIETGFRSVIIDSPELYVYIVHGDNTFPLPHFEAHWRRATRRFEHAAYDAKLVDLGTAIPGLNATIAAAG